MILTLPVIPLNNILSFLDEKSLSQLAGCSKDIQKYVKMMPLWQELVEKHFPCQYHNLYSHTNPQHFYKIYAVERNFSVIDNKYVKLSKQNWSLESWKNTNGNTCLWFTFTMPFIKIVAVILQARHTGLNAAIETIL